MANNISNYLENKLLDHILRAVSFTSPATVYVSLHTADPTDAGSGAEVSGGSYARVAVTAGFAAAASGATSNSAAIIFPTATGSWGTVTHFGIWDASTSGNLLIYGALAASVAPVTNDIVQFNAASLSVSLD